MRLRRLAAVLIPATLLFAACLSGHDTPSGVVDEPTEPMTPTAPTEPTEPTSPTEPTEPTEPTTPAEQRPAFCPEFSSTLTLPGRYEGRLSGSGIIDGMSCYSDTPGPEDHHLLEITEPTGVALQIDYVDGHISSVIAIRELCNDVTSELWCNRRGEALGARSLVRAFLEPGTYEVVVDQSDWDWPYLGGRYDLSVTTFDAAPHARCEDAIDIAQAVDQDTRRGAHPQTQHSCLTSNRPGLFYRATVPPRSVLTVRTNLPRGSDLWLHAASACAPTMAAECDHLGRQHADGSLAVPNASEVPLEIVVAAFDDDNDNDNGTTFDLTTSVESLLPNALCEAAPIVALDTMIVGSNVTLGGGLDEGPCSVDRALYYSVTVPPLTRVVPEVILPSGSRLGATFQDGCGEAAQCHWSSNYINADDAPHGVIVAMSPPHHIGGPDPFELHLVTSPVAPNAVCTNAAPLTLDTPLSVDASGGGDDNDDCHAYFGGRPLFYSLTVPAGESVRVTATPDDAQRGFELNMMGRNSCEVGGCDFSNFGAFHDDGGQLDLVNDGHDARNFVFSVALRFDPEGDNGYTLVATRLSTETSTDQQ